MFSIRVSLIFLSLLGWCFPLLAQGHHGHSHGGDLRAEAQRFLDEYTEQFVDMYKLTSEAQWASNTLIVDGVSVIDRLTNMANEQYSKFSGSVVVIEKVRHLLSHASALDELQVRQLQAILYVAANNPQTVPELVSTRIAAETEQNSKLFGFDFKLNGKPITPNDIDKALNETKNLKKRRAVWEASKEVGKGLKPGLANLVALRNKTVQALGYRNYFEYQVSEYGMSTQEMMDLMTRLLKELRPLYRELHTWARYELADRYGQKKVPELLPAHWLPNRWGQDWSALVTVEGIDLTAELAKRGPEWLVKQSERFYVSLGFPELPQSFYDLSSLYPVSADAGYKKNTHASAWHMDLGNDVRSLMSVEANERWYETTHHELGHIYYYMAYTNPEVPPLLRGGANRAFHEAIGSMLGMASMQQPFLEGLGLVKKGQKTDQTQALLKEALNQVVFMPFSSGTMSFFEHDLYATDLTADQYNQRWWAHAAKFQGIEPPKKRDESNCDGCTKTHINNDAAQYYDYALSYVILHQVHSHIAHKILKQDPRETNYYGNKDVGKFLDSILSLGATRDWRQVMRDSLGEEISAKPMLDYFAPLMTYLKEENKGRKHTLPEL